MAKTVFWICMAVSMLLFSHSFQRDFNRAATRYHLTHSR